MTALRQQSAYNVRVESLRGVAALVVAAAHAGQVVVTSGGQRGELAVMTDPNGSFWDSARQAYRWMTPAEGAVVLFFVISGYVLRLSLDRMKDREAAWIASNFLVRRALRLFPPVAFMVLIFALFSIAGYGYPSSQLSLRSLISHAFLLDFRMNGVIWTLQAELLAAPIILICWFILSRWGPWPVRAIGTALCLLVVDGDAGHMLEGIWPGLAPVGIPSFLFAFVFGMLVAEWTELIQSEKFNRFRSWWLVLGVALICAAPHISFHWRLVMDAISAIAILGAVVNGFSPLGNAVLSTPAARFLGKISYSFYLFHPLTLPFLYGSGAAISALLNVGLPTVAILPILLLATTLATLPLAMLSYKLAEEPSMTVSRMFGSNRPLNTSPAPAE